MVVAIPLAALLVSALLYFISENEDQQAEHWVTHTHEVRTDIQQALNILLDATNGVRGYLLTGQETLLNPYESAIQTLPDDLAHLARLVQNDPVQAERMHQITSLAEDQLDALTQTRYSVPPRATTVKPVGDPLGKSAAIMNILRQEFLAMQTQENRLLAERTARNERLHEQMLEIIGLSLVLGPSCGLVAAFLFTTGIGRRMKQLEQVAGELSQESALSPIPIGNDEIGRLGRALEQSSILLMKRAQELRGAKDEAEKANQAKSDFLSRMSHELRTPLNAILGFGQLLEMDHLSSEQRESVQHILKGGRHLLGLIDEVLEIARIETGHLVMSAEPVRVSEVLQEALDLVRPMAAVKKVRLNNEQGATADRHVLADRQRLKQVFLNLCSNAVKYNHEGGMVTLSCEETANGRMRVKVTDTGPGIPQDKIGRLFTPFDRLGAEQSEVEGTGLGLSLSKRLVGAMGGTLGVDSVPGRGSTFWLEFPVVESPLERLEKAGGDLPAPVEPEPSRKARVVLYIEDNLSNLKLIQRLLAHRPEVRLIPAMQGRLGLQLAREHHPDLILLDLQLPDILGSEALRQLREMPETREIPVVVISADATPGRIDRLLAAGAWKYLTKPLDVKKFLAVLDEALEERKAGHPGSPA